MARYTQHFFGEPVPRQLSAPTHGKGNTVHVFLIAVGLLGQVASAGNDRYGPTSKPLRNNTAPAAQGLPEASTEWAANPLSNTRPSGKTAQATVLQEQPPYRSRGQQQPAASLPNSTPPSQPLPSNQLAAAPEATAKNKPSQLIRSFLKPPTTERLTGQPLTLAEAIQLATSRSEQTRIVEAYWNLSTTTANYYLALREVTALQTLRQGILRPSAEWEQARLALSLRGREARLSAQTAQFRLQRLLGRTGANLPIASDLPHCGEYDTRFNEIFASRNSSAEAEQLSKLLPLGHQNLRQQTAHVGQARQWLDVVSQRRDPNTDGTGLLKAYELLSLRRRAFVESLGSYNANIARYAEMASPGDVGTARLVAMLIHTEDHREAGSSPSGIRQTSAEEAIGAGGEHSILTQPTLER